ncbi:hypothetical protein KC573_03430, partial [candidate division WWE3 bacterium]|nr:hypothetical protein [candidate division WWE3 bacterium]
MSLAPLILGVILGVIVVILGVYLLVQNYHQPISRNFSLATITIGIAVIASNLAVYSPIFTPQTWLKVAILFYMLTHVVHILFTYDFPRRDSMSRFGPIHSFFYFLMCIPLGYILITDVDQWFTVQQATEIGRYYINSELMINVWGGLVFVHLLIAYYPMYRRWRVLQGYEKEQIRLMLIGLMGLVVLWFGAGFIIPLIIDTNLSLLTLGTYAVAFYPVFTIYIIMRHRLFDVRVAQWKFIANAI